MLNRYPLKSGAIRVVAARLPKDHARTLRAVAARSGVPLSHILAGLVADWITNVHPVNDAVNASEGQSTGLGTVAAQSTVAIPARHNAREESGKAAPIKALMQLDETRKKQKDAAKGRD